VIDLLLSALDSIGILVAEKAEPAAVPCASTASWRR
jgi:hypothetical protein